MAYVGSIKERIEVEVKVTKVYDYSRRKWTGYGNELRTIYVFEDNNGNAFKADVLGCLALTKKVKETAVDVNGEEYTFTTEKNEHFVNEGDVIVIKCTVKDHKMYKDVEQTVINRVAVKKVLVKAETKAEKEARLKAEKEAKIEEQLKTLKDGDFIWKMSYKQYKEHYSDCETVIDSYECDDYGYKTIKVIIREGRLVNSGTRGRHYMGVQIIVNEGEELAVYRAISPETAMKRAKKEYPNASLKVGKIFEYYNDRY